MRAVGVMEFGGPDALVVVDLPERHAGPGEIRIRVHAATVNPTDTFIRSGGRPGLREAPAPYVPGMEAAGVLDEVGPDADTDLSVGDHVVAIVRPAGSHGAYAEQIVVPARSVARAPGGSSHAEAATLPMNGLTARLALDVLALEPGRSLAVTGAAGAFGGYVVQLAKAGGLRVIADASRQDTDLVASLGADVVVARGEDVGARIREAVPEGVDALADGALQHDLALPAVRDGGQLAAVRTFDGEPERGITIHQVRVVEYLEEHDKLDQLRQQVERGELTLRVARTFAAEAAAEAHRMLEAGGVRGRLVIEL